MIKNISKYMKILICFAVSSLLLLSISYAEFNDSTLPQYLSLGSNIKISGNITFSSSFIQNSSYSSNDVIAMVTNYFNSPTYESAFETMVDYFNNNHIKIVVWSYYNSGTGSTSLYTFLIQDNVSVGIYPESSTSYRKYLTYINPGTSYNYFYLLTGNSNGSVYYHSQLYDISTSYTQVNYDTIANSNTLFYSNVDIKQLFGYGYWDGSTYFYQTIPPGPSYIPSNSEIADKVQAFYDSDLFQNQNDFKDFFVLYNYNNETFSFIGHNLTTNIGQAIYRSNYPSNDLRVDYWSFYLVDAFTHIWNWFNNYYWLYTTTLDSEIITYTGKGAVTDLLDLKFDPTYSTIVYSTTDYNCLIYGWNDDEGITVEEETVSGDSYTYDENIDPTTSEYNPITNYVLPNSVDTLISNADIPGLLQIWVTPDFSNMDWIFLSISAFWGYFGGFVLLTAVMFFIMWLLRGD